MPCSFEKPVTRIYKLLSLEQGVIAAGTGATPAAFYLGLCRLRGILSLPASHDHAAGGQILSWRRLLQAGYSSMRRRRMESDAESAVATTVAGEPIRLCRYEDWNRTRNLVAATAAACEPFFTATTIVLHRFPSLSLKSRIDARKRA